MKNSGKVILLGFGAYGLTIGLAIVTVILTLVIGQPQACADYGNALLLLWLLIGLLCLGSTAVFGNKTWHLVQQKWPTLGATAVYGLLILFTYLFMAFVLMIAFNC